ncbi:MAG: hypothetical protein M0R70_11785 [Nitrospirae bacterium]|nr:hypothetical protein [Nitrospirota bacterium]
MKKFAAVLAVVVMVVSLVSMAFAADKKTVIVKSVDAKAATMVVDDAGKDVTMTVDKAVDLDKWKTGDKIEITVEKEMITKVKKARSKQAVGC